MTLSNHYKESVMLVLNRSTLPDPPTPTDAPPKTGVLQIGDGGTASHSDQMAVDPVPKSGLAGRRRYS
jgi:hypothetical protein